MKSPRINILFPFHPIVIKDWNANATNSHLAGGKNYHAGKLTVPTTGRYYIYLQIYYHSTGRILVRVNGRVRTMFQIPPCPRKRCPRYRARRTDFQHDCW